jgi:hypothetical protein
MPWAGSNKTKGSLTAALLMSVLFITALTEASSVLLQFSELYEPISVRGLKFSQKTRSLNGKKVIIRGFMAPPLKPDLSFFVLTRQPVDICPFCDSDADWPEDIVVVYLKGTVKYVQDGTPVKVEGILKVGTKVDKETGFVSRLRIVDAGVSRLR